LPACLPGPTTTNVSSEAAAASAAKLSFAQARTNERKKASKQRTRISFIILSVNGRLWMEFRYLLFGMFLWQKVSLRSFFSFIHPSLMDG